MRRFYLALSFLVFTVFPLRSFADDTVKAVTANADTITISGVSSVTGQVTASTTPAGGKVNFELKTQAANGTATVDADGKFSYTVKNGFTGADTFTFTATSGKYSSDAVETINVNASNASTSGKGALGFGVALVRNHAPIISDATIVNGVVRANSVQNEQIEILATYHWYFSDYDNNLNQGKGGWRCARAVEIWQACPGLFISFGTPAGSTASSSQLVDLAGVGFVLGWGEIPGTDIQDAPYNIGVGFGYRLGVSRLADGFRVNMPPPTGETQVRYTKEDVPAVFFFFTYNWSTSSVSTKP